MAASRNITASRNPYCWRPTATLPAGAYITGPYIDADKATNFPTDNYLTGLRVPKFLKLGIPQTLLARGRANDNIDHPDPAEEWRAYLCSAIVRHFSYKKFTSPLSTGHATPAYRSIDRDFMQTFMTALPTAASHSEARKESLVQLEHQLTHETFGCFPELFHKVFDANAKLACDVSTAMLNLDVIGSDFETPRAVISQHLHRLKTEWINLSEPIDVVSGNDEVYKTYIESQSRRQEIIARLVDYHYVLADPTPEMCEKARTRARVLDEGWISVQGSGTFAVAVANNDLPQQHRDFSIDESSAHHGVRSQQRRQQQDFRIHEDPPVTVFGVDPGEVRGALRGMMMRPVSPDVPYGQENRDPTRRRGERVGGWRAEAWEGEMEGRREEGARIGSRGLGYLGERR